MTADLQYSLTLIAAGALVACACALVGVFLVLRRMALVGDAISHAILPGLALGFMLTASRNSLAMTLGAMAVGLAAVWLIEVLLRSRRVGEDASIAIVFPALFAVGVLLMERYAHYVDLDPDCVIYGDIEFVPLDLLTVGGVAIGPKALWVLGAVTLVNLAFVLLCYKELKVCTFDPMLAESLGFRPARMHYLLMTAVAVTTVAAFESVGAILVIAFLIAPAAAAYLLTERLPIMLVLSASLGTAAAAAGYLVAREEILDCSVSGAMASMTGAIFTAVWLMAPRHGLAATLWRRRKLRRRFAADLLLLHLHKAGTAGLAPLPAGAAPGAGLPHRLLRDLRERGLIEDEGNAPRLTEAGRSAAVALRQGGEK